MKILFLSGDYVDFTTDLLFNGIAELYGQDSIIDYPYREWHHVKEITGHLYHSQPMHPPYVYWCSTIDKDSGNRIHYNFDEIKQLINQNYFDLSIIPNRALCTFIQLKENTIKFPRIIIINGKDDSEKAYDNMMYNLSKYWESISLFLQREYRYDKNYDKKVIPYTFSCPINTLPSFDFKKDKQIDVFCRHGPSHPFRQKVLDRIKQIKEVNIDAGYAELSIYDYFKRMNNSKISISIGGAGWDTPHYIEPPYMKSMLLAQHPKSAIDHNFNSVPVIYPNNFKDRDSAVFYKNDLSDIEDLIRYYIENEKEREEITKRGYEHLINHLTTKKMAEYVFKNLEDNSYWKSLPLENNFIRYMRKETKYVSTDSGKNMKKNNNIILGLVFGLEFDTLKPFLYSLARTGFNGELCLMVTNICDGTLNSLSLLENSSNYKINIMSFEAKDMGLPLYRYLLYHNYLVEYVKNKMNENEYNIMLTDVRDVVFQKDPFDFDINNSLCCFLEDKSKLINSCSYNSGWINDTFGRNVLDEIGSNMISCSGVTIGDYRSIIIYLETMIDCISRLGKKAHSDQGIHNYIIYQRKNRENNLKNKTNLKLFETGKGPVFTMGYVKEKDIIFNNNGFIINEDGSIANVLHQYDRHPEIYEKANIFQKLK